MFIRQLDYLITLARVQHFTRAAELCHVSQPGLSAAIKSLEAELGVTIIQRGQQFEGFTPEGERILVWARQTLAAWDGMRQEAALARSELSGTLRLGAIPTTMPIVALLTGPCRERHAALQQTVLSLSTEDITRGLDRFELDAGLTYLEDQRLEGFHIQPLYRERYMLLARDVSQLGEHQEISWQEAARLPMCLLTPGMQNRRVVDAGFRRAEVQPNVRVEADSIFALFSHVRCAGLFSIVPHSLLSLFDLRQDLAAIPLEPALSRSIGLISLEREPVSPLVQAIRSVAAELDLQQRFDQVISGSYQAITSNDWTAPHA